MKTPDSTPAPQEGVSPSFKWWWIAIFLAVWLGVGYLPRLLASEPTKPQDYADMFGMVNSLFSGLAFLGLIHTIRLQKDELRLQRQELRMTREELGRSTAAQSESAMALSVQIVMSSITAQISTLTHRRALFKDSIAHFKLEMPKGILSDQAMHQRNQIQRQIDSCVEAIARTQEEIDNLHERLVGYDRKWSSKLVNV